MRKKHLVVGLVLMLAGYILNSITIWIVTHPQPPLDPQGYPHHIPPIVGTIWLLLIPLGAALSIYSLWTWWRIQSSESAGP
jgi:hypothetical protein